jgi:hypothetical protein
MPNLWWGVGSRPSRPFLDAESARRTNRRHGSATGNMQELWAAFPRTIATLAETEGVARGDNLNLYTLVFG